MQQPLLPDCVYHIYNHANGSENLFRNEENYHYFLSKYAEYIFPIADTYAYCLMPNHFHLMVRIRTEKEIMAYLKTRKPTLQGFETLGEFLMTFLQFILNLRPDRFWKPVRSRKE